MPSLLRRSFRRPLRRSALAVAAAAALGPMAVAPAAAATCTWNTASGNWNALLDWANCVAGNGNPAGSPGSSDTANIGAAGVVTINTQQSVLNLNNAGQINIDAFGLNLVGGGSTTNTGVINVGSAVTANLGIAAGHNVNNAGGVINVANGSVVNQFGSTISGGTINTTGTGALVAYSSGSNFLSNVTLNGILDLTTAGNAREQIANGATINGAVNIANGGILGFNSAASSNANQVIGGTGTINLNDANAHISIDGNGSTTLGAGLTVQGQGSIGGASFVGGTNTLINQGLINANVNGGTLALSPPGNSGSLVNQGTLRASGGGTLVLTAATDNTAGLIDAQNASVVQQNGITILGGNITTSGSGKLTASNSGNNALNGVNLTGTLDLASFGNAREQIVNGATINGVINIANGGVLGLNSAGTTGGAQTLNGNVTINLNDANAHLSIDGNGSTTLGAGVTVRGQGNIGAASFVGGTNVLTSNGLISSDVNGGTLNIVAPGNSGSFINNGTLQAINGGTLLLSTNITANAGSQIISGVGSSVVQNGVAINGVFSSSGGGFTATNSTNNVLNGVSFTGTLDLTSFGNAREQIVNGATVNGVINIANGGVLGLNSAGTTGGAQALNGTATINLNDANAHLSIDGNGSTTLGANITVRGQGNIGTASFVGGTNALINNGLISADVGGGTLNIVAPGNSGSVTNNATLQAINGATLQLSTSIANAGQIVAGANSTVFQNGVTLNGLINTSAAGASLQVSNSTNNVLNGVNLSGTLDLTSFGNAREQIINGATINGAVNIASGGILGLNSAATNGGVQSLLGNVSINLNDANARLSIDGNGSTTLGAGVIVHGQGNIGTAAFVGGTNALTNNGLISADVNGGTLSITAPGNSGSFLNNTTMQAVGGGTLLLSTSINNAGLISAQNASTVVQNGVTLSGGTLASSGTGSFQATGSGSNFLSNTTLNGTLDMTTVGNSREQIINGATLNGAINIASGGILGLNSAASSNANQVIGGTGVINLNDAGAHLSIDGNGSTTLASGLTVRGQGSIGGASFTGGTNTLFNNGTILADGGTLTINAPGNSGTLAGTGTLQTSGGTLNLNTGSASTQGQLVMGAAGSALNLNNKSLTITSDYTNAQWGSGNSFNALAGVNTGGVSGQILAGGNAAQVITGANVTGGNTANATLTINNVRVGANTFNYQIADAGNTGPTLRGAIQTTVNGANLSDARLSGAGVTASNYSTGAPGSNSGNLGVTFTAAAAGALAPLNGQVLNLTSNFANIADQKLNIVLGNGAAAYNAAVGSATTPVQIANQRIGGSNSATVTVANTAVAGNFSEDLNVSVAGSSGASGAGSISGRLAGTNNTGAGAITVGGLDTSSAGAKSGTVTLAYQTAGAVNGVSNGLGTASVGTQTVTVSGNVYQAASGAIVSAPLNFGNVQAGTAVSQNLVIKNTAVGANGYVEDLNASFATGVGTGQGGNLITGSGSLAGIVAGASSGNTGSGPMTVTVNTGAAGVVNGSIAVNYYTAGAVNGVSNGLGTALVGSDNFGVAGTIQTVANVIDQAKPVVNGVGGAQPVAVDLGSVRIGGTAGQTLTVLNQATGNQQAYLNASIASNGGPVTASGSFAGLAPGASIPGTSGIGTPLQVGVSTTAAGLQSGSATISAVSDITSYGNCGANCTLNLANQTVNVSAKVYQVAQPTIAAVDLGATRVGGSLSGAVSVSNTQDATAVGFQEGLNAAVKSSSGLSTAGGTITNLAAGNTDAASITVGLGAATAGQKSGTVTLGLQSNGAGTSGLATLNLADSAAIAVTGKVYQTAVLSVVPPSPTIDFGIVRVGTAVNAQTITISNVAQVTPGYNDTLNASVSGLSGPMSAAANNLAALVAGGASGSAAVSLNTALGNAGVYSEIAHVSSLSQDGVLADVSGGSADVTVKAQINNLANAVLSLAGGAGALSGGGSHYTLDLGNIFQGTNLASSLTLTNQVAGPADELTGSFDLSGLGGFVASGWNAADLVAGASETGLGLLYDALNLGAFASTITFNANSYNTSQGAYALGPVTISIIGDVIQQGVGNVPEPGTLALLVAAAAAGWATRRRSVAARRAA